MCRYIAIASASALGRELSGRVRADAYNFSVCLSGHAILAVRAIKSIMKDTIVLSIRFAAILKWRFS